jgi:hypothetical protein
MSDDGENAGTIVGILVASVGLVFIFPAWQTYLLARRKVSGHWHLPRAGAPVGRSSTFLTDDSMTSGLATDSFPWRTRRGTGRHSRSLKSAAMRAVWAPRVDPNF